MNKIQKTDHFYLIDGSGYIFRAYYALPPLSRNEPSAEPVKDDPINVVQWWTSTWRNESIVFQQIVLELSFWIAKDGQRISDLDTSGFTPSKKCLANASSVRQSSI